MIEIIDKVVRDCEDEGNVKVRISVIGFRDHAYYNRYCVQPFATDVQNAKSFIMSLSAEGACGNDFPEDVLGGLKLCLQQDWTVDGNKKVFLIGDAPCHGTQYHELGTGGDEFSDGCPNGLVLEELMKEF